MYKHTRNPGYLGEVFVMFSFVNLSHFDEVSIICAGICFITSYVQMLIKDKKLVNKPKADRYFQRTWRLLPKFSLKWYVNALVYTALAGVLYVVFHQGGIEGTVKTVASEISAALKRLKG